MRTRPGTVLAVAMVALAMLSLLVGPAALGPIESLTAVFSTDGGTAALIMQEIRLPRALLGVMIGASLGLSGAALQGFLRNPLAEPGIIGVSSSASLGAVIVFYSGFAGASLLALPAGALIGALAAMLALIGFARGNTVTLTLILAGIALSSLAGALTSLVLNLSPNPFAAYEIIFWLLGSLKDRSMEHVWIALPLMLAGWTMIALSARALDALSFGEDAAASLGADIARTRLLVVGGVALSVGAATAVAGAIGFVGLVVPHLVRPFTDRMPGGLLLPSAFGGAALLTAADIAARLIRPAGEINVGVVTALIGAPFFLWLVARSRREAQP